jgi:nitrate reductase gamma subunit
MPQTAELSILIGFLLIVISFAFSLAFGHSFYDLVQLKESSGQFVVRYGMGVGFVSAGLIILILRRRD